MSGDSRRIRELAWECAELALTINPPRLRRTLLELSRNWLKLAVELERDQALLDEYPPPPLAVGNFPN